MPRIAAIDYGLKRIGIALSDPRKKIAFPFAIVKGGKRGAINVAEGLKKHRLEIEKIIVGLPLLLDGTKGDMAHLAQTFAKELQALLPVAIELIDERLSSMEAEKRLKEGLSNRKERSQKIDSAAAAIFLQAYLDKNSAIQL